jgi:hypothetical protein
VEGVITESLADLRAATLTFILSRSEPRERFRRASLPSRELSET